MTPTHTPTVCSLLTAAMLRLAGVAGMAQAQDLELEPALLQQRWSTAELTTAEPASFGTGSSWTVIGAAHFVGRDPGENVFFDNSFVLAQTQSNMHADAVAPLHLPNGAIIEAICMVANDPDDAAEVILNLWVVEFDDVPPPLVESVFISTGVPEAPGWATYCVQDVDILFQSVADFNDNSVDGTLVYTFQVAMTAGIAVKKLANVAVRWRRQISDAPVVATFGDVPTTHLFFRQIEALAASGITGGCGGGNFCPDASLTRGQMAAFLAKALGLHWPH